MLKEKQVKCWSTFSLLVAHLISCVKFHTVSELRQMLYTSNFKKNKKIKLNLTNNDLVKNDLHFLLATLII